MAIGCDAWRELGSAAAHLAAAKVEFVGRYYSHTAAKNLTAAEARQLGAHGIRIVSVWEAGGSKYANFYAALGQRDTAAAVAMAKAVGQPAGTPIYFAVDFDADDAEILGGIADYFRGVRQAIGPHPVGVYGSGLVCKSLRAAGLATYAWRATVGWRGGDYPDWHIAQTAGDHLGLGLAIDTDEAIDGDYGGWMPAILPAPIPSLPSQTADDLNRAELDRVTRRLNRPG